MPELTCEQVNGRIAKALGWTCRKVKMMYGGFAEADGPVAEEDVWFRPDGEMSVSYKCPDYCHDLNACAEVRKVIAERGLVVQLCMAIIGIMAPTIDSWTDELLPPGKEGDKPAPAGIEAMIVGLYVDAETQARALVEVLEEKNDAK